MSEKLRKIRHGRFEYEVRPLSESETATLQLDTRAAGAYLMDGLFVLDDLSAWKVVDKEEVEEEVVREKTYDE